MDVPSSCLRKSLHSLAGCMAAAFSCTQVATATDLALPDRSYGWVGIFAEGQLAAAARNGAPIDRLGTVLPPYLEGRRRDRLNVARDAAHPNATLVVTNCDDAGAGSLRDTIAAAVSGDTIDLTQLTCSTITLTSAPIQVPQDDLSIIGPGAASRTIDGGGVISQFTHYGNGTLSIDGITLTNGYYYYHGTSTYSAGGCIYSTSNVLIQNSVVSNCIARGIEAIGGGIFAGGDLTVVNSVITHNQALASGLAGSGAFKTHGNLTLQYSTVSDNRAYSSNLYSFAGAFHAVGNALVQSSTISGNQANSNTAFFFSPIDNSSQASIINSTVSGNKAGSGGFGGGYSAVPLTIYNSTIAFNVGGVYAYNAPLNLQSTIIADNDGADLKIGGTATVSGANNLIDRATVVPPGTIRDCPRLGPLADNGGVTLTHAPRSTSPAIDSGSNLSATSYDQRGTGFPRVFGAAADIGAVEWQGGTDEEIFNSGFESICDH